MYHILLVEDEEIELETLRDYIDWKKNGISKVYTARNGRRALECLEENQIDLVITDIQMPGMSGIELAEKIVQREYSCKIIFLTGYDDFSYIHAAFQVRAIDYLLKPFTIEEVEECLKKVRQELEKREVDEWSKKMAADQLLETILQTRMDRTLLEKNFRGVFQEEMKTCGFGIAAVYGTLNEDQCAEIQKRWKGIRYIGTKDSVCMLVMSGYMPVKDTAFQIWNTLKEEPKAVGWCMGRWTADQLYEKAEMLRNCRGAAFYCDPPALFCVDETIYQAGAEYDAKEQQRRREKICGLVSKEKPEETMQQTETYFVQMTGIDPSVFIREIYNLYLYLWNRLILSDELLERWIKTGEPFTEKEIFAADSSHELKNKMRQYLMHILAFFEKQNQNPNYYAVSQVKAYLQEHCSESANVEELAAKAGLSPNYLRSLFKEATGKTILEYNTEMRLQKAAELLKDKKNKVREVSIAVGYENVSYFGVVFQKKFGVTPNEYRKMV